MFSLIWNPSFLFWVRPGERTLKALSGRTCYGQLLCLLCGNFGCDLTHDLFCLRWDGEWEIRFKGLFPNHLYWNHWVLWNDHGNLCCKYRCERDRLRNRQHMLHLHINLQLLCHGTTTNFILGIGHYSHTWRLHYNRTRGRHQQEAIEEKHND